SRNALAESVSRHGSFLARRLNSSYERQLESPMLRARRAHSIRLLGELRDIQPSQKPFTVSPNIDPNAT
ncbi:MAG TPA: hypothetical protein V6C78_02975, partial [Crinalium sp.]